MKNRPYTAEHAKVDWTVSQYVETVQVYDQGLRLKGKQRKDADEDQKLTRLLGLFQNRLVSVTGYLVVAYAGDADSANYGNAAFHDWHLELYQKPVRVPKLGNPTPVMCEITRFTERQLYEKGVRLQPLISQWREIRNGRVAYQSTGHPPHKVRITGYLFWDDEHNAGGVDVGSTVKTLDASGFQHPWRQSAWGIHPVTGLQDLGT